MKSIRNVCLLAMFLYAPVSLFAQTEIGQLKCPFEHGSGREPKEAFTWDPEDKKVIMMSKVDTIVRSCITGTVSNVNLSENNKYEIVIYYKNYYFWYDGLAKATVKRGQNVKAGEGIGIYTLGTELDLRMFKHETQIDPRNLLECKIPKADDK
ncbi:MAG: M23 family metallopeptidase [Bacteroidota bacterium]|nr:M23 family metallopeptidase [Chitinophagaceae bacterium]MDZ4810560.1 M23 family metallopeptidase [Bacteroidota bacterium]